MDLFTTTSMALTKVWQPPTLPRPSGEWLTSTEWPSRSLSLSEVIQNTKKLKEPDRRSGQIEVSGSSPRCLKIMLWMVRILGFWAVLHDIGDKFVQGKSFSNSDKPGHSGIVAHTL